MSGAERFNEMSESPAREWEKFDEYIRQKIESTATVVSIVDETEALSEVSRLHKTLQSEGLIGLPLRIDTECPLLFRRVKTNDGTYDEPYSNDEFLGTSRYEGTFEGCFAMSLQTEPLQLLFYEIKMPATEDTIILRAPVDASQVMVEYPTEDGWEEKILEAFSDLEAVQDKDYQSAVEGLTEAFWNTSQPLNHRLCMMGIHATELLAHEQHDTSSKLQTALDTVLINCLDKDMTYIVSGTYANETHKKGEDPTLDVGSSTHQRIMIFSGVRYISTFEMIHVDDTTVDVKAGDTRQPAIVFHDLQENVDYDYPMRFIDSIEEYGYDQPTRVVGGYVNGRFARQTNKQTCGEWSHEYSQKHADGV